MSDDLRLSEPGALAAHLADSGDVAANGCGMLDACSEEIGDNGGCGEPLDFYCDCCGIAVCRWHTWSANGHFLCSVCYGIDGFERNPYATVRLEAQAAQEGGQE